MQRETDEEMGEEMEGIGDYLRYSQKQGDYRRTREIPDPRELRKTLIIWSVAIILLMSFMIFLFRGDNREVLEELDAVKDRIVQLEKRLPEVDVSGERVTRLENRISGLKKSISKLNRSVAAMTRTPRVVQKKSTPSAKERFHKVRRGDTLYRIAGKYGITVNQLRRYNKLDMKQGIHPGQKLRITPGKR